MNAASLLVLIVDDDATARRMLDVRVRSLVCQVGMAANGQEALAAVERETPALILLDMQLPDMDGLDVIRACHREGVRVPFIVISAYGSAESVAEAAKEGAADFIEKPFAPVRLENAVRRALQSPA